MHPAAVMQVFETIGHLHEHVSHIINHVVFAGHEGFEIGALDVFQHHVGRAVGLTVIDVADDVWVRREFAVHLEAGLEHFGRAGAGEAATTELPYGDDVFKFVSRHPDLGDTALRHTFVEQIFSKSFGHIGVMPPKRLYNSSWVSRQLLLLIPLRNKNCGENGAHDTSKNKKWGLMCITPCFCE